MADKSPRHATSKKPSMSAFVSARLDAAQAKSNARAVVVAPSSFPVVCDAAVEQGHRLGYRRGRRVAKPVLAVHNQIVALRNRYQAKHSKGG